MGRACCGAKDAQAQYNDIENMKITMTDPLKVDKYAKPDEEESSSSDGEATNDTNAPKSKIPTPPKWNPRSNKPKTQAEIMALLKGHIRQKMIPPPPFTKAMAIPAPVVQNKVNAPFHQPGARVSSVIPTPPPFKPKKPRTQAEIMALLQGHIRAKMVPPPPFSKAMAIPPPPTS